MKLALRVAAFCRLLGCYVLRQSLALRATMYATGFQYTSGVLQRVRQESDSIARWGRAIRLENDTRTMACV
jgi:hypothetical protein